MYQKSKKIIGVLGGMGPEAGMTLMSSILNKTKANTDQDHLPVILMSFPGTIPDRTLFLAGKELTNPAESLAEIILNLESAGAAIIGMACNTAHAPRIYDKIQVNLQHSGSKVRLMHMPLETCRYLHHSHPYARRIGVMSTNGTYYSGIYSELLSDLGFDLVLPTKEFQENVIHPIIYDKTFGIKANPGQITDHARALLDQALDFFSKQNTDVIILGCTELSKVLQEGEINGMFIIDSTESLARALVKEACENAH